MAIQSVKGITIAMYKNTGVLGISINNFNINNLWIFFP